jgi:MarR family 2-MHQ and catechol resistance regulon transcriptional repressor
MTKKPSDPVHCWLVWRKAHEAASDYLYRGIEETGISDTDFRVLEALLHKGPPACEHDRAESPPHSRLN